MKTVTVKYAGWHARPAAELAQMQARLKEIAKQRDALREKQQRLWEDSSELRYEQEKLSRWVQTRTREPEIVAVNFNGIGDPRIVAADWATERQRKRILALAVKQFAATPPHEIPENHST
jgi:hypothetical protein